jgi:hypothetical protein
VKLDQFRLLCQREWAQEDSRGDVTALHLTDASYAELEREAIMDGMAPGLELFIKDTGIPACGVTLSVLLNPLTRSPVKVGGGSACDMMEVRCAVPYRLLEPAAAAQ